MEVLMKLSRTKIAIAATLAGVALIGAGCADTYSDRPMAANGYSSPAAYGDDPHYASYGYYADQCQREKQNRNVAGTIIGGVAGALVGNAVSSGGGKTGGTIIGGVAGAAIGSNVARSSINCDGGRPYWRREQTADYDSYAGYNGRHNSDWYRQHDCRWVHTDRGDDIRVCRGDNDRYYPEY
jgi:outer membrane lipoprotein SlyB